MDKELHKIAVRACQKVYKENIDLGTTEYSLNVVEYNGEFLQVLAIAGSNERKDWFINFNLTSWKGIKWGAYRAAKEINQNIKLKNYPLLVCGHSKSGPTAIAFKRLFGADYCVSFAPAPGLRPWVDREMENTTIFIDPDDIVHLAGGIVSFRQPECEVIELPNNHKGLHIMDHHIDQFASYILNS